MQKRLIYTFALMLAGGILASCGMPTNSGPGTNPDPTVPSDISALVIEVVDSPVYDELAKRVKMVPYDGSQKAADHDLVILDGDAHDPDAVATNPLVKEALDAGTSVLLVDATGGHKREGLGKYLGFASKEDSPAYLARLGYDENHRAEVHVVEFPSDIEPVFTGLPSPAPVNVSAPGAVKAFVDRALAVIGGSSISTQQGYSPYPCGGNPNDASLQTAQSSGEVIPDGAIYKHVFYCVPVPWTTGGTYETPNASQTPYFDTNYTFTIIYDNANEPQGNFQWVVAQMDVSAVPNGDANGAQVIINNNDSDRGWFQDSIVMDITPADATRFTSWSDVPATVNGSTTITTQFQVGISSSSSAQYSNSQAVNMLDWRVINDSDGATDVWNFTSNYPIDGTDLNDGFDGFGIDAGDVKGLNDLNTNQLQFSAQAAWKTGGVQTDWVDFKATTEHHVANLDSGRCQAQGNCVAQGYVSSEPILSLNMAAVLPVSIGSMTFAQDPFFMEQAITASGTITLSAPAPEDIAIPLTSSDPKNFVVDSSVTVKQGDTSADFSVNVPNVLGDPGKLTGADITASYAQGFTATIQVQNVSGGYPTPPVSAPVFDNYATCVGTTGEWVAGYGVRYTVAYVNNIGESIKGPWMGFFGSNTFALPELQDVPTDPSGKATSRNIYRQFSADYNSDPNSGIKLVGTIDDNTTTTFQDNDAAETTFLPCPN